MILVSIGYQENFLFEREFTNGVFLGVFSPPVSKRNVILDHNSRSEQINVSASEETGKYYSSLDEF